MNILRRFFYNAHTPFVLLLLCLVVWLIAFPLFRDGMFIDGIQYAAISRNLARGIGSFWFPVLAQNSVGELNTFHEHPPLVFFLQSFFFRVFGLHNIYPERIYCLTAFATTALFVALTWRKFFKHESSIRSVWWLPVIMWTLMPVVFWAYANNIQENTMAVFTTASVYFFLCALRSGRPLKDLHFYIACATVVLAFLCKGVPALFPVAIIFIYWISFRSISFSRALFYSLVVIGLLLISGIILLQNEAANHALHIWFFDRMLHRIAADPVVQSHFYILAGLFTEQLPAIAIGAGLLLIFFISKFKTDFSRRDFIFFLLLGLSGSLPLMLTLVQRNFYFTPALPLFAIAWAVPVASGAEKLIKRLSFYPKSRNSFAIFMAVVIMLGATFTIAKSGSAKRDVAMLHDVYELKGTISENSFVSVTSDIMWANWSFRCYMMRYNSVSFSNKDTCNYFIAYPADKVSDIFSKADIALNSFALYKRKQRM